MVELFVITAIKKHWNLVLFALPLSVVAVIILITIQKWGLGITTDTLYYVSVARSLSSGKGLLTITDNGTYEPLTHYPPLTSFLVNLVSSDHLFAFQIIALISFFLLVLSCGSYILWKTKSLTLMILSQLLIIFSRDLLSVYSMAWSEHIFILLFVIGSIALAEYVSTKKQSYVILSAILCGVSILSRYSGVFLIPCIMVITFLNEKGNIKSRVAKSLFIGFISAIPIILWLGYLQIFVADDSIRQFNIHFIQISRILEGYVTIAQWFSPFVFPKYAEIFVLLIGMLTTIAVPILFIIYRQKVTAYLLDNKENNIWGAIILSYFVFLVASISFFDPLTPLDFRILSPIYPLVVLIMIMVFYKKTNLQFILYFLVAAVIIGGVQFSVFQFERGTILAGPEWEKSETIAAVKQLPKESKVFSNAVTAVYVLGERENATLPLKVTTLKSVNPYYKNEIAEIQSKYENQETYIVFFKPGASISAMYASEKEITSQLSLSKVTELSDGIIFKLEKK
jgi:hypothetical protein